MGAGLFFSYWVYKMQVFPIVHGISLRKFAMNFNKLLFKHENVCKIAGKQSWETLSSTDFTSTANQTNLNEQ